MRPLLFVLLVSAMCLGCDGKPLTGPEAQKAVQQYKDQGNAVLQSSDPLIFLNGVRVPTDGRALTDLDPAEVETVEVVKGETATKRYGPDGSRGVILITTKRAATRQRAH